MSQLSPTRLNLLEKETIIWYNPSFNKNVKSNIGKTFLKLVNKEFPSSRVLHKNFNRKSLKISYSCCTNIHFHNTTTALSEETLILRHITAEFPPTALFTESVLLCRLSTRLLSLSHQTLVRLIACQLTLSSRVIVFEAQE